MAWLSVVRPVRLAIVVGLVVAGVIASGAGAAPVASCHVPTSQTSNVKPGGDSLAGVAAISPCNVWAVGEHWNGPRAGGTYRTLIEHWNGRTWKVQKSPNPGANFNQLFGVAATSSNNAWAVGDYGPPKSKSYRALIEHWNGRTWKVQKSPDKRDLSAVTATSAVNAWAVDDHGRILHWDGKAWKIQKSPKKVGLNAVTATSANNAWAVGAHARFGGDGSGTLVEHWNGKTWKVQKTPNLGRVDAAFTGVTATSAKNAWAVGDLNSGGRTLIEHWNGKAWKVQPTSPDPRRCAAVDGCALDGVAATSGRSAWAVGSEDVSEAGVYRTLVEHWNGKTWKIQKSPDPGSPGPNGEAGNGLSGIAATSATRAWAVGAYYNGHAYRTLALRWNGTSWTG